MHPLVSWKQAIVVISFAPAGGDYERPLITILGKIPSDWQGILLQLFTSYTRLAYSLQEISLAIGKSSR